MKKKHNKKEINVCVIGTGYVGLVQGVGLAEFGLNVICVDKDKNKINSLRKGKIPFYEPGLEEIVERNVGQGRLSFTTDITGAVRNTLVIFIAVGTPSNGDGSANLKYVEEAAKQIAQNINGYKVIVTKSTVPVGTGEKIKKIISKNLKSNNGFDVVSNPEFLREGSAVEDFMRPDRVIIGVSSKQAASVMKDLYKPLYLIETPFIITDVKTAELIKYASNSFLAVKIGFINEMSNLCEAVGTDVHIVAKAMGLDNRIGPKFLHAGPGFGGSCFPKDVRALDNIAKKSKVDMKIIEAVLKSNEYQKKHAVKKIKDNLGKLKGATVCVLGLAFKPNTDDIRESPAVSIAESLVQAGIKVRAYDPAAIDNAKKVLPKVIYCKNAYDAAKGSDAVVIATEWNQFRNLNLDKIKVIMKGDLFFDLRNVYEPEQLRKHGFNCFFTGRQ